MDFKLLIGFLIYCQIRVLPYVYGIKLLRVQFYVIPLSGQTRQACAIKPRFQQLDFLQVLMHLFLQQCT